jgi:hypothetical protein
MLYGDSHCIGKLLQYLDISLSYIAAVETDNIIRQILLYFIRFVLVKKGNWFVDDIASEAAGWGIALEIERSQFRFRMVSLEIIVDIILRPNYGAGVDSASKRNWYQEYFLGWAVGA